MRAIGDLTLRNPNPHDGEPFYNLGLARFFQGKTADAYDAFYKSVWNYAWQSAGNYALASISAGRREFATRAGAGGEEPADECGEPEGPRAEGFVAAPHGPHRGGAGCDQRFSCAGSSRFSHDGGAISSDGKEKDRDTFFLPRWRETFRRCSMWASTWPGADLPKDAFVLLQACSNAGGWEHPMLWYTLSWLAAALNRKTAGFEYLVTAEAASPRYCFPGAA